LYFKRGQRTQQENQAILKIEDCNDTKSSLFYHGKRVAYVYKSEAKKRGTSYKAMWGKIASSHGNSGLVKAKFAKNLPPRAIGAHLRVMLYPNRTI
jgi:large subunit ribosomal protein L35Ae